MDGESKAALRSAVPEGLLEYRRTCDTADTERVEVQLVLFLMRSMQTCGGKCQHTYLGFFFL